jgi:DNA repair photolyase
MERLQTAYENGIRTCSACKTAKPILAFSYQDKSRGKLQARCKVCCAVEFKRYRLANLDRFREYKRMERPENQERRKELRRQRKAAAPEREFQRYRKNYLKAQFGITPEDYDRTYAEQGGVCAICGADSPGRSSPYFHVDHCHATNVVRGLLCNGCNLGLGHFKDNVQRLAAAINYLGVR